MPLPSFPLLQGYKQCKGFIIAQAPMKDTCRDFWKMVFERDCGLIVMLSDLVEDGEVPGHTHFHISVYLSLV